MKKILVPVDFSPSSENALDFAMQLNEIIKGKITLLHVLELPASSVNYGGDMTAATAEVVYRRELIEGTSTKLHELEDKVRATGQEASIKMEFGSPYKGIGKELSEEGADWIIMGSKGASGLKEIFVGSNAERVIRHSKCPVITIKEKVDLRTMKSMVFASDLSMDQDGIAGKAQQIQELLGLNMHILRVKTPYNYLTEEVAKDQLEEFAERNGLVDYSLSTIEADFSEDGIIKFAEEQKAGLIVMGTHGRTGIAHLFGGSRAEDVANHSKIPLLTFKIEG
ncbi:MAG: universal stress protein [Cytophagales bacterium]|nr:universal stress protein [Cytophagales bacterium]